MTTKLSKPQQRIYDRLQQGEKVTNILTHRQSGGEFVWVKTENGVPDWDKTRYQCEYVGYRAFWNLMRILNSTYGTTVKTYIHRFPQENGY